MGNFTAGLRRKENVGFYICRLLENAFPKARKIIYSKFLLTFRLLLVESSVIIIFYVIFLMRYAGTIINYFEKKNFSIKRKQGVNYCFRPLILSVFTTVGSRLKSEQKEKEK